MDHLPLPNNPVHGSLAIPFLSTEDYDGGNFKLYPSRKGWSIEGHPMRLKFFHHNQHITNKTQLASFLQTWLYFGFLSEVTEQIVDSKDFREEPANGYILLNSTVLTSIVGSWSKTTVAYDWSHDLSRLQSWVDEKESIMLYVRNMVVYVMGTQHFEGQPTNDLTTTCFVISLLGEYVGQTISEVDLIQYKPLHRCKSEDCSTEGPPVQALAKATKRGAVCLVTIAPSRAPGTLEVVFQERQDQTAYVAISHVWADGMGNVEGNALPICVLSDLQDCVNTLSTPGAETPMPFWLDTLCLPRNPPALRKQGLAFLSDAFTHAKYVLVIDPYLRNVSVDSMTPTEILARIAVSDWSRRLWTLSEGRLANRVAILFQKQPVEVADIVQRWRDQYYQIPCLPSHDVNKVILTNSASTRINGDDDGTFDALWRQISYLRVALKTRATSWKYDEAICISTIIGLDTRKIVEIEDENKMIALWALIPGIPCGLVFSPVSQKLPDIGFRWAPSSFMGEVEKSDWDGPPGSNTKLDAEVTPRGLKVKLPGLLFGASGSATPDPKRSAIFKIFEESPSRIVLKDKHGRWYRISEKQLWHQEPAVIDFEKEEPAIILGDDKKGASLKDRMDHEAIEYRDGLLVTYPRSEFGGEIMHAKAHKHVQVVVVSKNDRRTLEGLRQCHGRWTDAVNETFQDDEDADPKVMKAFSLQWGEDYVRREGLVQLEKERIQLYGLQPNDEDALNTCLRRVWYYEDVGPYLEVQELPASTIWCVD